MKQKMLTFSLCLSLCVRKHIYLEKKRELSDDISIPYFHSKVHYSKLTCNYGYSKQSHMLEKVMSLKETHRKQSVFASLKYEMIRMKPMVSW